MRFEPEKANTTANKEKRALYAHSNYFNTKAMDGRSCTWMRRISTSTLFDSMAAQKKVPVALLFPVVAAVRTSMSLAVFQTWVLSIMKLRGDSSKRRQPIILRAMLFLQLMRNSGPSCIGNRQCALSQQN